jgi:glycerol-3-phosphate acyltransferase PlsY
MIIAKAYGIDLRRTGSGNIGATNVLRTVGKWQAFLTMAGDMLKGAFAVMIGRHFFGGHIYYEGIIGLFSILGHNYSIFLKFRGGKGVATSLGVLNIYSPQIGLFTIIIWIMTVLITKYSSLGALVSFGIMPVGILLFDTREKFPIALLISILLFMRHRDNISRLIKGTEPKAGKTT